MNLYAMIFGRVSAKTMSGPLTIANVSYRFAGEDFWQFLLFIGMISVNLAVVNFLPIPVLDGGHMVFLDPGEDPGPTGAGAGVRIRRCTSV